MKQVTAIVEKGQIRLPETVSLPDGSLVRVVWDEEDPQTPFESEPWTEEELQKELAWATGKRF
jgi:hypothetical protein